MDKEKVIKAIELANEAITEKCHKGDPLSWTHDSDNYISQSIVDLAGHILIAQAIEGLRTLPLGVNVGKYHIGVDMGAKEGDSAVTSLSMSDGELLNELFKRDIFDREAVYGEFPNMKFRKDIPDRPPDPNLTDEQICAEAISRHFVVFSDK